MISGHTRFEIFTSLVSKVMLYRDTMWRHASVLYWCTCCTICWLCGPS